MACAGQFPAADRFARRFPRSAAATPAEEFVGQLWLFVAALVGVPAGKGECK